LPPSLSLARTTTRSIAACRHSQALTLFRCILRTSASIPDAFASVLMDMGYEGRMHQKMHADGGAATQVFFYPSALDARGLAMPSAVPCSRPSGASATTGWMWRVQMQNHGLATIAMLLHFNGGRDISRIYLTAQWDGLDFCLSYIASNFAAARHEPFELACMRALSDSRRQGLGGVPANRRTLSATADHPASR